MRTEMYKAICKRIEDAQVGIKHMSLWNNDTELLTEQPGYATPAVFVEFEPIVWEQRQNRVRVAEVRVWLHIVISTMAPAVHKGLFQDKALGVLDQVEKISSAIVGLSGECFNAFMLKESDTDHDHKQIQHHKECFVSCVTESSGGRITFVKLAEVSE